MTVKLLETKIARNSKLAIEPKQERPSSLPKTGFPRNILGHQEGPNQSSSQEGENNHQIGSGIKCEGEQLSHSDSILTRTPEFRKLCDTKRLVALSPPPEVPDGIQREQTASETPVQRPSAERARLVVQSHFESDSVAQGQGYTLPDRRRRRQWLGSPTEQRTHVRNLDNKPKVVAF